MREFKTEDRQRWGGGGVRGCKTEDRQRGVRGCKTEDRQSELRGL